MFRRMGLMLCIVTSLSFITQINAKLLQFEAEDGAYDGSRKDRSEASGQATVLLSKSQSLTNTFITSTSCSLAIHDVAYTNDGASDSIEVYIDDSLLGSFNTISASNFGRNWNVVRGTGRVGERKRIDAGSHTLRLTVVAADTFGVELDKSTLNITCNSSSQPGPMCTNISALSSSLKCNSLPYATRQSTNTSCAEEDNVNIPIFYSGVKSFQISATIPEYYPSMTTMNNRKENFANCKFTTKNIWTISVNDSKHSEFSSNCTSDGYKVGDPHATFCNKISDALNNSKYIIHFTAKGIKSGLVEASIGSILTVKFAQVTGDLVIEIRCFGRDKKWIFLGNETFSSGDLTKIWRVHDLTWSEEPDFNQIEMKVVSRNTTGKFDYLKLDKRGENGESTPVTVFNNGATIIEAISIDFWWLYPKGMIIKNLNNNKEWRGISYFRIYRKIPGTSGFSQLFVLYQDGNTRILPFPPDGIDWIPFGSSVIIGPAPSNSVRPHASITRVNIDVFSLQMEIHYESGGKTKATLQYTGTSTTVKVEDISYTTTSRIPFTTFRSMWVADGNGDVDGIQNSSNSWHVQHGWRSINGLSFRFFRLCVSTHNTLSPDILIVVECANRPSKPTSSNQSTTTVKNTNHSSKPTSSSTKSTTLSLTTFSILVMFISNIF